MNKFAENLHVLSKSFRDAAKTQDAETGARMRTIAAQCEHGRIEIERLEEREKNLCRVVSVRDAELERSRGLFTAVRALAERTRIDRDALAGIDHYRDVYQERDGFLEDLNALLAAHEVPK